MMSERRKETDRGLYAFSAVTSWLVLALLLLFAGLSVALIALGGQAYRATLRAADENAHRRASIGYVTGRIRAFDMAGAVRTESAMIDGETADVLILSEEIDGEIYETRIYCVGKKLREQFVSGDTPLESAEDGEAIASLSGFQVIDKPGMMELCFIHPDGTEDTVHTALHSRQEGAI